MGDSRVVVLQGSKREGLIWRVEEYRVGTLQDSVLRASPSSDASGGSPLLLEVVGVAISVEELLRTSLSFSEFQLPNQLKPLIGNPVKPWELDVLERSCR